MTLPAVPHLYDGSLVERLQRTLIDTFRPLLDGAPAAALVDFPYHRNAGDAAIWIGERAVLSALGIPIKYVADAGRYNRDRLREAVPQGPILLHGGGSLGDLWPWPQRIREQVLRDFRGRTVIQLPQSICFRNRSAEQYFGEVVRGHGAYVLVTRDAASHALGEQLHPSARLLAPDMAFGLGPLIGSSPPDHEVLVLARNDVEESSGLRHLAPRPGVRIADWTLGSIGNSIWQIRRVVPRAARLAAHSAGAWRLAAPLVEWSLDSMAEQVFARGVRLLSSAKVVVTDRLHAHILCLLLDKPHVVLDNSYKKISSLHSQWTAGSVTTHWATDPQEALDRALRLASET